MCQNLCYMDWALSACALIPEGSLESVSAFCGCARADTAIASVAIRYVFINFRLRARRAVQILPSDSRNFSTSPASAL